MTADQEVTREYLLKAKNYVALLPPPGGEEVTRIADFALNTLDGRAALIAGALFDFCAHLTCRPGTLKLGAKHNSPAIIEPLKAWAKTRGLNLDEAAVQTWQDTLKDTRP